MLTEGLKNVFYNDEKKSDYQLTDSMVIEWQIENNQIKHVEMVDRPTGTGEVGTDIVFYFAENYYQRFDTFRIDKTHQQCQVLYNPERKNDNLWAVTCRLVANDYDSTLDLDDFEVGDTTTWISTANVELSEEGYSKFQSSFEKRRNYLTTFRHDISWSSLYALKEDVFLRICDDKDRSKTKGVFKMLKKEKELLDTFHYSVNTGLLLAKGNIDVQGRPTIQDPYTNRPVNNYSLAA